MNFWKLLISTDSVFSAEIIITYSLHSDLTSSIARLAAEAGVRSLIVPGGPSRASIPELKKISEVSGMDIEVDEICCSLEPNAFNRPFTDIFGSPILKVKTKDGKICRGRGNKRCSMREYMAYGKRNRWNSCKRCASQSRAANPALPLQGGPWRSWRDP